MQKRRITPRNVRFSPWRLKCTSLVPCRYACGCSSGWDSWYRIHSACGPEQWAGAAAPLGCPSGRGWFRVNDLLGEKIFPLLVPQEETFKKGPKNQKATVGTVWSDYTELSTPRKEIKAAEVDEVKLNQSQLKTSSQTLPMAPTRAAMFQRDKG